MEPLLRSRVDSLPTGPFKLKHIADNSFHMMYGDMPIGLVSLSILAADMMEKEEIPPKDWPAVLEKWVEEGGACIRWVSWAHRPIAFPDDQYLTDATDLNPNAELKGQYGRCSSDRAFIGETHRVCVARRKEAEIKKDHTIQSAKARLARVEAEMRILAPRLLKERHGVDKVNEKMLDAFVDSCPEVVQARENYATDVEEAKMLVANAEDWEAKYKNVLSAIDTKVSMLMMLGSHIKEELKLSPHSDDHE